MDAKVENNTKKKAKKNAKKKLLIALGSLTIGLSAMKLNKNITTTKTIEKERKAEITKVLDNRKIDTELGEFHYIDLYNITTNKSQYIAIVSDKGIFYDVLTGEEIGALDEKIINCTSLYEDIYNDIYNDKIKLEDVNQENIINSLILKNSIVDNNQKRRL